MAKTRIRKRKTFDVPAPKNPKAGAVVPGKSAKEIARHPQSILKAICDSGGLVSVIAERLGCTRYVAERVLTDATLYREETYYDIVRAYKSEQETTGDIAEMTLREAMTQRLDIGTAARTAQWWLERKHGDRGFANVTKHEHSGSIGHHVIKADLGDKSLDDLTVEEKRRLVEQMDEEKKRLEGVIDAEYEELEEE